MPSDGKTIHSGWYIDEKVCSLGKYYVQSSEIKKGVYVPTYIQKYTRLEAFPTIYFVLGKYVIYHQGSIEK